MEMELHALQKRATFSALYERLLKNNPEIEPAIHSCIDNTDRNIVSFFYGGRMWNKIVHQHVPADIISNFPDVKKSAILSGNYDMVAVVPDAIETNPDFYETIYTNVLKNVKRIHTLFKTAVMNDEQLKQAYDVELDYDKLDAFRTITIGRGFRIYLNKKSVRTTRGKNPGTDVVEDGDSKLLFYLELGKNMMNSPKQCMNIDNAKWVLLEQSDSKNLSIIGLIMLSQFLVHARDNEKGLPIDNARAEIMRDYLLPIVGAQLAQVDTNVNVGGTISRRKTTKKMSKRNSRKSKFSRARTVKRTRVRALARALTRKKRMNAIQLFKEPVRQQSPVPMTFSPGSSPGYSPAQGPASSSSPIPILSPKQKQSMYVKDPVNALLYITIALFPGIFNLEHFILYRHVSGSIMENIFKLYYPDVKSEIDTFNSDVLDAPGGMTDKLQDLPSLRQLLMLWITHIAEAFNRNTTDEYSLQLSGGDVFRLYLTTINQTADIDTKLFYTTTAHVNMMQFMFFISTVIAIYLNHKNYFRVEKQLYDIKIGSHNFIRMIDTHNQDLIATSRVLPQFTVPLVSIDLKLNGYILCPDIVFEPTIYHTEAFGLNKYKIPIVHSTAPLDVSLIQTPKKSFVQQTTCHPIEDYRKHISSIPANINMAKIDNQYCAPPYPPLDYLVKDLENIVANNKRPQKRDKDVARLNQIKSYLDNSKEFDMSRMFAIQQVLSNTQNYVNINNAIYDFIHELMRDKVYQSKTDLDKYKQALRNHMHTLFEPNVTPDIPTIILKVLTHANLYKPKPTRYLMPHSYTDINEKKTGDDESV